jgi:four helix bundle protein
MSFRFEDLQIWNASNAFATKIYTIARALPRSEQYGLGDQLRRAANSIPVNIAEGAGSTSKKDFAHFLNIAIRSLYEVVSLMFRCEQEGYLSQKRRTDAYQDAELLVKRVHAFRGKLIRE